MRIIPFLVSAAITTGLAFLFNQQLGPAPPPGKFLSPQQGFWQNADDIGQDFSADFEFAGLKGKTEVYLDERLVPHVFAENDQDLYFVQGFLHARFRLFQMDLQTRAAEGRASEIAGERAINYDRTKRRLGMKFAAENALREIEKDPVSLASFSSYTDGVNAYISSLTEASMPFEYKLLDFKPEKWSNIRTALLLKMMAEMLSSGTENDLAYTNAKTVFSPDELKLLYPQVPDSLLPIVPKGTVFPAPGIIPVKPLLADSLYLQDSTPVNTVPVQVPDPNNGSNNWVVAGSKTASGAPILSNDPHLELSLPSIWFEIQLQSPTTNAYGVSLPGSPYIIIGFNDSIAWGVTNAQRDVKDYFEITYQDASRSAYKFENEWKPVTKRIETIHVKGGPTVYDTVAYTIFGPVMYDQPFSHELYPQRNLAVRWIAHDPSNEGMTFYKLNRARNYAEYEESISTFDCPGQNFVFASKSGDIALWQQGKFPARWERQGLYIMPGADSSFMWQGYIPQNENPHSLNPERGFLQSANQRAADSSYPYFIPGSYITPRGISIDKKLAGMNAVTPQDMMDLQADYFNVHASEALPLLLKYLKEEELTSSENNYLAIIKTWDLYASPDSRGQTIYQCWWDSTEKNIWQDELSLTKPSSPYPEEQITFEILARDSSVRFVDNITTSQKETLVDLVTSAFKQACAGFARLEASNSLVWSAFKNPTIYHLLKDPLIAFARRGLPVGGNGNVINAITHSHGPSWRMIVHLTSPTEAYGVYPAGQNGNPGSPFYDNFVDTWAAGKYYPLWFMREGDKLDKRVKWVMKFTS